MMETRKSIGIGVVAAVALLGGMLLATQSESAFADTRFGVNRVNMAGSSR